MSETNGVLIRAENMHKVSLTEEVETHALAGIHLSIGQGEYVSIAEPSGCGKSALMAILGFVRFAH
jgi:putative ABC transport system ATP-binding protein